MTKLDSNRQIERLSKLSNHVPDDDYSLTTAEERWHRMWPLAVTAWAMKGVNVAERDFQRDAECLKRLWQ
jgi:hypothetical protein